MPLARVNASPGQHLEEAFTERRADEVAERIVQQRVRRAVGEDLAGACDQPPNDRIGAHVAVGLDQGVKLKEAGPHRRDELVRPGLVEQLGRRLFDAVPLAVEHLLKLQHEL